MMRMPPRSDEEKRVAALQSYKILDTGPEATFDRLVRIARTLFDVPVAKITMIDRDRAWTKAVVGEERKEKPRWLTFCNATVAMDGPLVVEDAASDERFRDHPSVVGDPHYRFYAGFPLRGRDGHPIGTLCCFDHCSRTATDDQVAALQDLGQLVVDALEMRLIATSDTLTGFMTRLAFLDMLRRDVALAVRHGRPLSAMLVGIDDFDKLVATKGHAAGDQAVRRFADLCRGQLRSSDYVGNMGNNRFALILRETFVRDASIVAGRLRDAMKAEVFDAPHGGWGITVSTSLVGLGPRTSKAETLLAAAEQALAAAMVDGGRQTVAYERFALRRA